MSQEKEGPKGQERSYLHQERENKANVGVSNSWGSIKKLVSAFYECKKFYAHELGEELNRKASSWQG